jgi:protein-disulfide isomerase
MNQARVVAAALLLSSVAAVLSVAALYIALGGFRGGGAPLPSDFEARAHAWVMDNPEVVLESFRRMEERQQAAETNELKELVQARADEIFRDRAAPVGGNPDGDVTLVEFFDYNCPYCRKAAPSVIEAVEADEQLRIVFKEFPILGPGSEFAARAALAAERQGKYEAFHHAMMNHPGQITEGSALKIAGKVGLDIDTLKQDMEDPAIRQAIERNLELAGALRINGTPSWVVGDDIVRGLVDLATLQRLVSEARAAGM